MTNSLVSKLKRFSLFPLAIILVLSSSVFIDQKAYADDHDKKIRAWTLYRAQQGYETDKEPGRFEETGCFDGIDYIRAVDVSKTRVGGSGLGHAKGMVDGEKKRCSDIYEEGIPLWGFKDAEDFLTQAGYVNKDGWWGATRGVQAGVNQAIRKKLGIDGNNRASDYLGPGELYSYSYKDFTTSCPVSGEADRSQFSNSQAGAADKGQDGFISYDKIGKDANGNDVIKKTIAKYSTTGSISTNTCRLKASTVTKNAQAAIKAAGKNKKKSDDANKNKNGPDDKNANKVDAGTGESTQQANGEDKEESKSRCAIDGIGWAVCPVVNFLADIADDSAGILAKLLEINSFILTDRGPDSAFYYWSRIRDIANIVFIIVFLIIIYSQVSGLGISNYGIKKLLPKLLITIVLVNISFYLCSVLVDISNVIGSSSFNFITSLGGGGSGPEGGWATKGNWWTGAAATVLGTATAFFVLGSLVSGLVFVVVTATVTVFLLGARQALVIFTIILSPLAFVALLLPSTEGLFKKWWGFFKTLLLLYPAVGLLYGACNLGATVINGMKGESPVLLQIIAAALTFTPLLLVSRLTSLMTSMMGLANIADKWGNLAGKATEKKLQSGLDNSMYGQLMATRQRNKERRRAQIQAGTYRGSNWIPTNWVRNARSKTMGGINNIAGRVPGAIGETARRAQGNAANIIKQQSKEEMDLAEAKYENIEYVNAEGKKQSLTQGDYFDLAMGKNIMGRNKKGELVPVLEGAKMSQYDRRFVLQRAAKGGNSDQIKKLAEASVDPESPMRPLDAFDLQTLAEGIRDSGAASKNPWVTGSAIADIQSGRFNFDKAVTDAAKSGKITAPKIAQMDAAAADNLFSSLRKNESDDPRVKPEDLSAARKATGYAVQAALDSPELAPLIHGNPRVNLRVNTMKTWREPGWH